MKKEDLHCSFDWQQWQSSVDDLREADLGILNRLLFYTLLIHEFERVVLQLKGQDCIWGPVHSSIGQEAIGAAAIAALRKTDKIAGTHRAHHQVLAKVVHHALPLDWDPVREPLPTEAGRQVERTLAEIMGLADGYCGGRGGSMHLRHVDAGVLGTNAIVGGGIPLATGAAFAEKFNKTDNIVVCFFGDGAINQGAFHEALNLAGVWNLPIICVVENNLYAVATRIENVCAVGDLSRRADSYGMTGRIVDGMDPLAIYAATKAAADAIRSGGQPCVIEARCYRHFHHQTDMPGSAFGYRSKEEEAQWWQKDTVATFPTALLQSGRLAEEDIDAVHAKAKDVVAQAVESCTLAGTPRTVRADRWPTPESITVGLRSEGREWQGITYHEPENFAEFEELRYSDAIAAVIGRWLERDRRVFVLGEEVANFRGGAYGATKNLPAKYPERILNTPISEAGFIGLACGAAMDGLRPVVEIMFPDFSLVAADQLFTQIAKVRHIYGNTTEMPLVVRTRVAIGLGYGGQHSMDPVALYALFPGWRIVVPSNAFDYIGLFNSAMRSLDPVLIVEHHSLYSRKFLVPKNNRDYFIPFGKARVAAPGDNVTVLTFGSLVDRCQRIGEQLREQEISVEVIDLRTLDLLSVDYEAIDRSLQKTGRVVIVEQGPRSQAIGTPLAAELTERFFNQLKVPVMRLTSQDIPNPVSRVLETAAMITDATIHAALKTVVQGHGNGNGK